MDTFPSARVIRSAEPRATLVLLPSLGTTAEMWDSLLDGWDAASRLDVILFDLPGHGRAPARTTVDISAFALEVVDAVSRMKRSDDWIVAGVSMGGAVAVEIAASRPSGLRAVASFNSALRFGSSEGWERIKDSARRAGTSAFDPAGTRAGWFSTGFANGPGRAVVERILTGLHGVDLDSYIACCDALDRYDGRASAAGIDIPGIAVGGRDDASTPPELMRELAAAAPGIRFAEVPGAHLAVVENPLTTRLLLETLLTTVFARETKGIA